MVEGSMQLYLQDLSYFDDYDAETKRELVIRLEDASSGGYEFTLPQATIMNPDMSVSGPGSILPTFQIEGESNGTYTIQIEQL